MCRSDRYFTFHFTHGIVLLEEAQNELLLRCFQHSASWRHKDRRDEEQKKTNKMNKKSEAAHLCARQSIMPATEVGLRRPVSSSTTQIREVTKSTPPRA